MLESPLNHEGTARPMKLAFSAWAMREAPVDRQIDIVRRAGYVGICLVSGAGFGLDALSADAAERRRVRRLLDEADLTLTGLAGHADLLEPDADRRAANIARIKATLDLAADLAGVNGPAPVISMGFGTPATYATDRDALVDRFGELASYAEGRGGTVALEAHVGQAFDLPEKVDWLMRAVNSAHFRFNLDNSHFECMGRDMDEYLPLLVPYSVHTDLKDQSGRYPDHQFLVPGEGDFDYARYLKAMQTAGYTGYVTIEISVMVQHRPGYDPAEVAMRSFDTLIAASRASGVALVHREAIVGA
jgi:sugar phosphate isomerase/epimerase